MAPLLSHAWWPRLHSAFLLTADCSCKVHDVYLARVQEPLPPSNALARGVRSLVSHFETLSGRKLATAPAASPTAAASSNTAPAANGHLNTIQHPNYTPPPEVQHSPTFLSQALAPAAVQQPVAAQQPDVAQQHVPVKQPALPNAALPPTPAPQATPAPNLNLNPGRIPSTSSAPTTKHPSSISGTGQQDVQLRGVFAWAAVNLKEAGPAISVAAGLGSAVVMAGVGACVVHILVFHMVYCMPCHFGTHLGCHFGAFVVCLSVKREDVEELEASISDLTSHMEQLCAPVLCITTPCTPHRWFAPSDMMSPNKSHMAPHARHTPSHRANTSHTTQTQARSHFSKHQSHTHQSHGSHFHPHFTHIDHTAGCPVPHAARSLQLPPSPPRPRICCTSTQV